MRTATSDIEISETLFQPIVELATGHVVAHEALTRFASGGESVLPVDAIAEAYAHGSIETVDALCLERAVAAMRVFGQSPPHSLFLNVEPPTLLGRHLPDALTSGPPVTVEITERALADDTGRLLSAIARLRELGHAIAIDDLGAEPATLALLPLIAPDVIKLDMGLIRQRPGRHAARIMTAVADYTARRSAVVLAEGVETERHEVTARALGATLAQGWHYGRPAPAGAADRRTLLTGFPRRVPAPAPPARDPSAPTPFEVVSAHLPVRRADRALLLQVSQFLEDRALAGGDSAVVVATFQHESNVTPATLRRYRALVEAGCLLTVFATGDPVALPAPARSLVIDEHDPLAEEWDVIVLTAEHAAALTAREVDPSQHAEGRYDFVLTTDRELVAEAARQVLMRS